MPFCNLFYSACALFILIDKLIVQFRDEIVVTLTYTLYNNNVSNGLIFLRV